MGGFFLSLNSNKYVPFLYAQAQALISISILFWLFIVSHRYDMADAVSQGYLHYHIPNALSSIVYGYSLDYTAVSTVMDVFVKTYQKTMDLDRALLAASTLNPDGIGGQWFIWGNDKGGTLYAFLAFKIFGIRSGSLLYFYFLLLSTSVFLFYIAYYKKMSALFVCNAVLAAFVVLAHMSAAPAIQMGGLQAQRIVPLLGVLPLLHLLFAVRSHYSYTLYITMPFQALMLGFSVFLRASALWMVICIALITAISILLYLYRERKQAGAKVKAIRCGTMLLPISVSLLALVVLNSYQSRAYQPRYYSDIMTGRNIWHNTILGIVAVESEAMQKMMFGCNELPSLTGMESSCIRDLKFESMGDTIPPRIIRMYLYSNGRGNEFDRMYREFRDNGLGNLYSHADYEKLARETFFYLLKTYPTQVLHAFAVKKPEILLRDINKWSGDPLNMYHGEAKEAYETVYKHLAPYIKDIPTVHLYRPYRLGGVLPVLASLLLAAFALREDINEVLLVVTGVAVTSMIPGFLAYPFFVITPEIFMTITVLLYVTFSALFVCLGLWAAAKLRSVA